MCDKCNVIDKKIIQEQRRLATQSDDADAKERTAQLVREMIAQKLAFHAVPTG